MSENKKRIYTLKPRTDIKGKPLEDLEDVKKPFSWFLTKARSDKALKEAAEKATRMPHIVTKRNVDIIVPIDDSDADLAEHEDEDHDEQEY